MRGREKGTIIAELILLFFLFLNWLGVYQPFYQGIQDVFREDFWNQAASRAAVTATPDFIRWVDFNVSYEALCTAYDIDVESYGTTSHIVWTDLLAYQAARYGDQWGEDACRTMQEVQKQIENGEASIKELAKNLQSYEYYRQTYEAVLGGYLGEYQVQTESKNGEWVEKYGLKVFSPIAKGFAYSDYDDFGASRGYGYSRPHLGHDMMGLIGTPIVAVESGVVEAIGWNQYGGWRIGIRSKDKKRYYYYAHLRQNRPYAEGLKAGDSVQSGDVIGYMGHTGYSTQENVNNIDSVHLHFGIQLIFDESQKDGNGEIWIDCYNLARFLSRNRCQVEKDTESGEWKRVEFIRENNGTATSIPSSSAEPIPKTESSKKPAHTDGKTGDT